MFSLEKRRSKAQGMIVVSNTWKAAVKKREDIYSSLLQRVRLKAVVLNWRKVYLD